MLSQIFLGLAFAVSIPVVSRFTDFDVNLLAFGEVIAYLVINFVVLGAHEMLGILISLLVPLLIFFSWKATIGYNISEKAVSHVYRMIYWLCLILSFVMYQVFIIPLSHHLAYVIEFTIFGYFFLIVWVIGMLATSWRVFYGLIRFTLTALKYIYQRAREKI